MSNRAGDRAAKRAREARIAELDKEDEELLEEDFNDPADFDSDPFDIEHNNKEHVEDDVLQHVMDEVPDPNEEVEQESDE